MMSRRTILNALNTLNSAFIATLATAAGLLCATSAAQAQIASDRAYVIDSRNEVAKSGFGLCWRTGSWTPAAATNDAAGCSCDKDLMPKDKCEPVTPKPAVAPAQTTPPPKKCDFTYIQKDDLVFEFNKATIKPGALETLDREVIAKLSACADVRMILITGHTDRLGSHQYNQKLSEKRAEAAKAYLVKQGVAADIIGTMGAGKTQAVPGVSCNDKLPKKKLIDCLAPNRRTVVEVQGTAR
jgi:OOP family OmpA-OmpF porin